MGTEHVKGSPNGARKCYEFGHRNNRGEPCGANAIAGKEGCWRHVGKSRAKAKAEGQVVVELRKWGLMGSEMVDPGETLLRLVSQSAARCELYARLLGEAFEAAERLRAAEQAPEHDLLAAESARLDLERILNHGGVGALVGNTYAADKQAGIFATGEAIRGLAKLESDERERCANFAAKAVAAGLAERTVRLAEQTGAAWAQMIRAVFGDPELALTEAQRAVAEAVAAHHLRALVGGPTTIEGQAA